MPCYSDNSFACGSLTDGPLPTIVDAPAGSRIKFRFHQRELAKAFIRHANGSFSVWSLQWVDNKARTLRLLYPIANITRQRVKAD